MKNINFNCPNCKVEIEADASLAGGTAECPECNSTILVPMPGITRGMVIAGFKLDHKLGTGGMGEVWLATQTAMDRKVALKILSPGLTNDKDFVGRFMQEVRLAGKLEHPNIVTAFDAGVDRGIYYLAISFVDGAELGNLLKIEKIIEEKKALKIIRDIARALEYAWDEYKILHRDIKPSNIMIDKKGTARLMDLGISKSISEDPQLTMTGMIVGTPYYMSPEQALSKPSLDFRADLYSLGATLYHIATGNVPYDAETAVGILTKHITDPLPSPQTINHNITPQCCALIEIMMAKNKGDRYKNWAGCIRDIDNVIAGKMPETPTPDVAAEFTETRTFSKPNTTYEKRLDRFKNFKPKIVASEEGAGKTQTAQKGAGNSRYDSGTKVLKKFEPPPSSTAGKGKKRKKRKDQKPFSEKFMDFLKIYFWYILVFVIILIIPLTILVVNAVFKRIETLKHELKEIDSRRVIFRLRKETKEFIENGQYEKAAAVYRNYSGPLADETIDERNELADEYLKMGKAGKPSADLLPNGK